MVLGSTNFDIDESAAVLPSGKYLASDMKNRFYVDMHNAEQTPSTIVVPAKMSAALFVHDNFEGQPSTINGPAILRLSDEQAGKVDGRVRSIIVKGPGDRFVLNGHWQLVHQHSQEFSYQIEIWREISDSRTTEKDITFSLSITNEAEVSFAGAGAKTSVTTTVGSSFKTIATNIMNEGIKKTLNIPCTPSKLGNSIALY